MYRHPFLSDAQREAIETAHFDLDDREIARYWTLADQVDTTLIERNWDDLQRLAESIRTGKVSASLLVSKLAAYPQHSDKPPPEGGGS